MRGTAADNRAERNNRVAITTLCDRLTHHRYFEGTGCSDNVKLIFADAMTLERIDRAFE
jgi:hypothetical protein